MAKSKSSRPSNVRQTQDDSRIKRKLRAIVTSCFVRKDFENLTIKRVRREAEQALDLDEGFFKNDSVWDYQSKSVVNDEVVRLVPTCMTLRDY